MLIDEIIPYEILVISRHAASYAGVEPLPQRGEQANAKRKAENARDIASAEVGGTSQSRKLSKNSGRIVSSKRRGR